MMQELKMIKEVSDVEEAVRIASEEWKVPPEEIHAEVIKTERGFLGLFGNRKVEVELTANVKINLAARGIEFIDKTLALMDFDAHSVLSETESNMIDVQGEDAADYFVGRYGDALKAMEYIVNLALRDPKSEPRLRIDSCGYRERRTKSLERLAEATARQALKFGRPIRLDPMASWERWVIHSTLKNKTDITTESVGETPTRRVVVIPKFDPDDVRMPGPATMRVRTQRERVGSIGRRNLPERSDGERRYPRKRGNRDRRNNSSNNSNKD